MVRVVFAHHFNGQTIQTCDDTVALTVAPIDKLLLVLSHNVIEVRDLSDNKNPTYTFSTIDQASFIAHCLTGNYIVTLESKVNRQGRETVYTRVYANWDQKINTLDPSGPSVRARIAGRVTPSSSQTGDGCLEMIELPVKFPSTSSIACCQETGNILIACNSSLCLFQLVTKTHDISKVKFLDFELWPITLELSFVPSKIQMVEDIISIMNNRTTQVFRINKSVTKSSDLASSTGKQKTKEQNSYDSNTTNKAPTCINLDDLIKCATENNIEPSILHCDSLPFTVLLPSISSDVHNSTYRISPFKPAYAVNLPITIKEIPANEPWAERMSTMVEHLIQLELITQSEEICTVVLRALYRSQSNSCPIDESNLPHFHSCCYANIVAINFLVSTHQEAFLYHFPVEHSSTGSKIGEGQCITTYSFTSAVINVVLEPFFLHALTHNNLETYTVRTTHHALFNDKKLQSLAENTVSLVGLRPFLNVVDLIYTLSYLIVIAASDSGTWTVYLLKLPSAAALYHDIVALASNHQFTALTLYAHLLAEAHSILETAISLNTSPGPSQNHELDIELYAESCMLMGDYYICTSSLKDWTLAYQYYTKAKASPSIVMERLKKLEIKAKEDEVELNTTPGFVHCLTMYLNDWSEPRDHELPHTAMTLLMDLAQNIGVSVHLSSLVLKSPQLTEYFPERTIHIIQKQLEQDDGNLQVENVLALCLLLLQRDKLEEATNIIHSIPRSARFSDQMVQILEDHSNLLFDDSDKYLFSELSLLLMMDSPCEISLVLSKLITEKKEVDLQHMVQVFLRLSNPGPHISLVLQLLLEQVLSMPEFQDIESIKILVRSYLSDIQRNSQDSVGIFGGMQNVETLFKTMRPSFLKELPSTLTLSSKSQLSLMKLECLLCSNWLNKQYKQELCQYISTILPDCISLQVLCQPQNAVEILSKTHPEVIPVYAKDMFDRNEQWKSLVEYLKTKSEEDTEMSNTYSTALQDILCHLATCMTVEQLSDILPPGSSSTYQHYLLRCQQIGQADHLRSLIMATGHQLLTTLNL